MRERGRILRKREREREGENIKKERENVGKKGRLYCHQILQNMTLEMRET